MAQSPDFNVDDGSGISLLSQLNTMFPALASSNSGASEPPSPVAGMIWLDTGVTPAALRLRNTANTAWNIVITNDTPSAGRAALVVPARPQTGAGAGQWQSLFFADNTAAVLPSGGTWAWFSLAFLTPGGTISSGGGGGVDAGGTTIGPAVSGRQYIVLAWRIL